jgi:hypothetical protein
MNINDDWFFYENNIETKDIRFVINREIKNIEPLNKEIISLNGKKSNQYLLLESFKKNDTLINFKNYIVDNLKNYFKIQFNKKVDFTLLNAWTVLGNKDSFHTPHQHCTERNNHIACVIYLKTPKVNEDKPSQLYFFYYRNNKINYDFINPKENMICFFPANMFHGTTPQGAGLRQTLNMDFSYE